MDYPVTRLFTIWLPISYDPGYPLFGHPLANGNLIFTVGLPGYTIVHYWITRFLIFPVTHYLVTRLPTVIRFLMLGYPVIRLFTIVFNDFLYPRLSTIGSPLAYGYPISTVGLPIVHYWFTRFLIFPGYPLLLRDANQLQAPGRRKRVGKREQRGWWLMYMAMDNVTM